MNMCQRLDVLTALWRYINPIIIYYFLSSSVQSSNPCWC